MERVAEWERSSLPRERVLGQKWMEVLSRRLRWRSSFEERLTLHEVELGRPSFLTPEEVKRRMERFLPKRLRGVEFHVDMAHHDPRPLNPWHESKGRASSSMTLPRGGSRESPSSGCSSTFQPKSRSAASMPQPTGTTGSSVEPHGEPWPLRGFWTPPKRTSERPVPCLGGNPMLSFEQN